MNYLDSDFIVSNAIKEFKVEGSKLMFIYFLIDVDEVVYVGKTKNVKNRMYNHENSSLVFDRFYYISVNPDEVSKIESDYVVKYNPKYNKAIPSGYYNSIESRVLKYFNDNKENIYKRIIDSDINLVEFRGNRYLKKSDSIDDFFDF